jgi:hypothetical protein
LGLIIRAQNNYGLSVVTYDSLPINPQQEQSTFCLSSGGRVLCKIGVILVKQYLCIGLLSLNCYATQTLTYTSAYRGRTYTVQTTNMGVAVTFPNHWMYQASVIMPSALTNNQ